MSKSDLYRQLKKEEKMPFSGWDFSYLNKRIKRKEKPIRHLYEREAKRLIKKSRFLLDIGTGGGEILAAFKNLPKATFATESYKPNVLVARKRLKPLGIRVKATDDSGQLPFKDEMFDLIIDRHSYYNAKEVFRVLKPGGIFLTRQVDGKNLSDLIKVFSAKPKWEFWCLSYAKRKLSQGGFKICLGREWSNKIEFKDVGAIVYFLKAIPWIVEGFSVGKHLPVLEMLQNKKNSGKKLIFTDSRFLIKAQKPIK